jgi:parallel beta-helix repeat protein
MNNLINKSIIFVILVTILVTYNLSFAQANNNAFLFDGTASRLFVKDGPRPGLDDDQSGFSYFNPSETGNNQITVQAWIYLLGNTLEDEDVEIPIIYRAFNGSTTFSLYVKNNRGYFTVGNSVPIVTPEFNAFRWIALTGSFDGSSLKIYLDGVLVEISPFEAGDPAVVSDDDGLYVGNSESGALNGLIDEITSGNLLEDLSTFNNHLHVEDIDQILPSKHLPFIVVRSVLDEPDEIPGDGSARSVNGNATLRAAIEETNALAGEQIIYFYITDTDPVITPLSTDLPPLTESVRLYGQFQKGYEGFPLVKITGDFAGLTLTGGGSTVTGLEINDISGYSLTLSTTGGNTILNNQIAGMSISSSDNIVNDNTVTNSFAEGISVTAGADNNTFVNNEILNNLYGNGISIANSNGYILSDNNVSSNNLAGIVITNSSGVVDNNTVSNNDGIGISLSGGSGNQVTDNRVGPDNAGGISISNSVVEMTRDTVEFNTLFGITLNTDSNSPSANIINDNAGHGFVIIGNNNALNDNDIYNNHASGVYVQSGNNNSILDNRIYHNSEPGIILDGVAEANDLQAAPELESLYAWRDDISTGELRGGTFIRGTLNSVSNSYYKIQFFANLTNSRDGERFFYEMEVETNGLGLAEISLNLKDSILYEDEHLTATATLLEGMGGNPLNTSEFSNSLEQLAPLGDHYIVNTTLAGVPLHWKDGKADYQIAPSVININEDYETAIINGFNVWNGLDQLSYMYMGTSINDQWGGDPDGVNNVVWIPDAATWQSVVFDAPPNVAAVTRVRYNALNGELTDVDIAIVTRIKNIGQAGVMPDFMDGHILHIQFVRSFFLKL